MIGDGGKRGKMAFVAGWGEEYAGAAEVAEWVVKMRENRSRNQASSRELGN